MINSVPKEPKPRRPQPLPDLAPVEGKFPSLRFAPDKIGDFTVESEGLDYAFRLVNYFPRDYLIVIFHGAINRERHVPPLYARWHWSEAFRARVLCVADPIIKLHRRLRIGWYAGTAEQEIIPTIVKLCEATAANLGIARERIVYYGSSAGGFAAIQAAAASPQGRFVAINPQADIVNYKQKQVAEFAEVFQPGVSPLDSRAAYALRWNGAQALAKAVKEGKDIRGIILQNTLDEYHCQRHFPEYCAQIGLPPEGGISSDGKLRVQFFSDEAGHDVEPRSMAREISRHMIPAMLDVD